MSRIQIWSEITIPIIFLWEGGAILLFLNWILVDLLLILIF